MRTAVTQAKVSFDPTVAPSLVMGARNSDYWRAYMPGHRIVHSISVSHATSASEQGH